MSRKKLPESNTAEHLNKGWVVLPGEEAAAPAGGDTSFIRQALASASKPEDLSDLSSADRVQLLSQAAETYPRARWAALFLFACLLAIGLVWFVGVAIGDLDVSDSAGARGLITTTFTYGTVAVGLILLLSMMMGGVNAYAARVRFREAKEVFTLLLGILGTVVGFYFGAQGSPENDFGIRLVQVSDSEPEVGGSFQIGVTVENGVEPYEYEIRFNDPEVEDITGKSDDRYFSEIVDLQGVSSARQLNFEVVVTSQDKKTTSTSRSVRLQGKPATKNSTERTEILTKD